MELSLRHVTIPAHLEPRHWVVALDQAHDMPFYVWDVAKREMRYGEERLEATSKYPEYVTTSHT